MPCRVVARGSSALPVEMGIPFNFDGLQPVLKKQQCVQFLAHALCSFTACTFGREGIGSVCAFSNVCFRMKMLLSVNHAAGASNYSISDVQASILKELSVTFRCL